MNLFDQLVTKALKNQPQLSSLKIVVEKELLHHDILRILSQNNLLTDLTFIGGTCLRTCYGGIRLSEDLDFTGGADFSRDALSEMSALLVKNLHEKYSFNTSVSAPQKEVKNVDTWKVKVETRPEQKDLPTQRINIDVCTVPSYEKQPIMLLNPYGVDMGTSGLILQAQSREEIYADKLLAFALRPNRLKYRDLWDMMWLHQQRIKPRFELLPHKLQDRKLTPNEFLKLFDGRFQLLSTDVSLASEFQKEMSRFLPTDEMQKIVSQADLLWSVIVRLVGDLKTQIQQSFD